ncbi:MAG: hypothetical protein CO141_01790 [Candidatus Moranbacteria bacterium CG_4_9_14_3_um_filter_42_9]|nr:MAG: hypothetical protein CO141_01790 [Candidatus Moranbacteria bacterium CG_4_9_14_3_um_filter_42_9]
MAQQNTIQKNLLDEMGLSGLPPEEQERLLSKMTGVLLKKLFLETMERLKDADREIFKNMLDSEADLTEVEKFLQGKIENYDQILEGVSADFKEKMKNGIIN